MSVTALGRGVQLNTYLENEAGEIIVREFALLEERKVTIISGAGVEFRIVLII